jgi:ADP-ribosylglycohydrolase
MLASQGSKNVPINTLDTDRCIEAYYGSSSAGLKQWEEHMAHANLWHESSAKDALILGAYTDDTQFTRELGLSLLVEGGFCAKAFAGRLMRLQRLGEVERGGRTSRSALKAQLKGCHWRQVSGYSNRLM